MRFLIDASSDARFVAHLRRHGHDVARIGWDYPPALTDVEVLAIAFGERRILITDDRDFGKLIFLRRRPHAGVIYLRLATTRFAVLSARPDDVLANHADKLDQFLIVTRTEVRARTS